MLLKLRHGGGALQGDLAAGIRRELAAESAADFCHAELGSRERLEGVYRYKVFGGDPDYGYTYGFAGAERNNKRVGQFVKAGAEAYINPLRAYLINHNKALAKSQGSLNGYNSGISKEIHVEVVDENDNVVDSGTFNTVTGEIRMNGWFDVKGRRLKAKPTARGNYYHNGKHVIVK